MNFFWLSSGHWKVSKWLGFKKYATCVHMNLYRLGVSIDR
jgi:hypothetical protein